MRSNDLAQKGSTRHAVRNFTKQGGPRGRRKPLLGACAVLFMVACAPTQVTSIPGADARAADTHPAGTNTAATGGSTGSGGASATGTGGSTVDQGSDGAVTTGTGGESTGGSLGTGGTQGTGGTSSGRGGSTDGTGGRGSGGAATGGGAGIGTGGAAGSAGGNSGNATGGAGAYSPCPAAGTACVILPFGDSITYGYGTTDLGGYRSLVFGLAVADSKSLTFVGGSADGPSTLAGRPFPRNHEGHSSYTIDGSLGITPLVDQGLITKYKPNIVLLMIGTNDMSQTLDLPNAPTRLGKLIDKIVAGAPNALIVVAKITPSQKEPANTNTQAYNAALPAIVQTRVSQGKHVVLVDMYTPFVANSNWKSAYMTDSVHPKEAGYRLMGDVWYSAIKGVLH